MAKKKIIQQQGKCPKCGSSDLEYGSTKVDDQQIAYEFDCIACGFEGYEWYSLEYIESVSR